MKASMRALIERTYNAEYKKGRQKNFFFRDWYDDDGNHWFELTKQTSGCGFTVKFTDNQAEMEKFLADYKLVKVFGNVID